MAARTDVSFGGPGGDDGGDVTRNLDTPDASALVERVLELVASEAETLLAGDDRDGRMADLYVRTALASWDARHQAEEASRFFELAERHPLAPRMRIAAALAAADPGPLDLVDQRLGGDPVLGLEIAEAWLWRHGRADRAAVLCDRLLQAPSVVTAQLREVAALAHAACGDWARVIELRRDAQTSATSPEEVAATAALLLDRLDEPSRALDLCWERVTAAPAWAPGPAALGWLRVLDVGLAAATALDDERRFALLEKRAELLTVLPEGDLEALATRHAVAAELERDREHAQAAALWTQLADEPAADRAGAARRIAQLRTAWSAGGAKDHALAIAAHRALSAGVGASCPEVAGSHIWRAVELATAAGVPEALDLARALAEIITSPVAERWLDLLELTAPTAITVARLEARGGGFLRWAAAIAERLTPPGERPIHAARLWTRAVAEAGVPTSRDHLARVHRGGDEDALALAYADAARAETDPRCAAALWCARGIVDLARGDFVEAEDTLRQAAQLGPRDPFCRAALAAVYRTSKRHDALALMLAELALSLASPDARAQAAREYAELLDEHLGDPAGARAALERMVAERPADPDALLALARLCDRGQAWDRALELRRRAAELVPTAIKRAEILVDIARGEERRGDIPAALAVLQRAVELGRTEALREQVRLLRAAGQPDQALAAARAELATEPGIQRRMLLQHDIAQLLTELGRDPRAAVLAYLDVLAADPNQPDALAGIEAPARALGMWEELARAFRGARRSPHTLEVLGEALTHQGAWAELVDIRRRQLDDAGTPAEHARRASELATLYAEHLGDREGAIRMLTLAQGGVYDAARQRELVRLLGAAERWAALEPVLERALDALPATDLEGQTTLMLELGALRAQRLGKIQEAIGAYENVLQLRPGHEEAATALEALYAGGGRDRELLRVLEVRAESTADLPTRSQLYARVAGLRATRGDTEGALAAYTAAFAADPANREVFTSMERVCYKAERWAAAMQLYESAIAHVENGATRAYRLGDLYARRGNVQLNFLGQLEEAVRSFQKVVEVDAQPTAAVKVLESLCVKLGTWKPLIDAYEQRGESQRDPAKRAEALRAAALIASEHVGDHRLSMRLQHKLLTVDPMDPAAVASLERHYQNEQDNTGLVDLLKLRLAHVADPEESIELLKKIARTSEEGARDVDTATEHYKRILEIEPENREALDALGRIYESTEQWADLIEITKKQIKVTTDRSTKALLYFRAGSVMESKFAREHDAIRYYDAAIKASATCLPAVHGLRDLYRRRAEWPRVIETLELEVKLWQDDKERAGVFAQIGSVYDKQLGDAERALRFYETALEVDPECLPANQALFEHHFAGHAWDKAQPIADALAQKSMREGDPTTRSDFYRKRGIVARMTGDPRAAAESMIVALEIKPTSAAALDDLGALVRERPDAWDFETAYRELEKVYKKREDVGPLLARVHVGRAVLIEREGDLDQAAELYQQALELAPDDLTVLSAVVDFHADMRRWTQAVAAIELFLQAPGTSADDRLRARMRLALLHGDSQLDAPRAIAVLREVLQTAPEHQDAYYQLAQQCFLIGAYADARAAIDRVIELASAPGVELSAEALARYYYYKGRILDAAGDPRAAAPQYRRATEYDPAYAPPALVLARRSADAGDQRQAETILIEAAHAAMAQGGPRAAVPLQRGLARILLASGDRAAAIEAYRGILNVEPDSASDRVALAEIYAVDDPPRAIGELRKVLERDIHHAPAYRLLASFHTRTADVERANRVLTALDLLGFAEEADRSTAQRLRAVRTPLPLRSPLDEDRRERLLLTPAAREPLGHVFSAFAEPLSLQGSAPSLGENLTPAQAADPRLLQLANELGFLFEVEADVFVAERVPGLIAVTSFPRRVLVLDRMLLVETEPVLRFLVGYALEAIRGGYAMLLQLGARQRKDLAALLRALLAADAEIPGPAADLVNNASPAAQKVLEQHAGARDVDASAWIDGMLACAKRAGLLACDDFAAAIWAVARLSGERPDSHDATVALGSVLGGPDLVRFYLSDDYQQLRDGLTAG